MDDRLERIARKLAGLPARDDLAPTFGARRHRFRLDPPIPLGEVTAFETRHGIRLPEEYRRFITELGGSGAGPSYGLCPPWDAVDMRDPLVNLRKPSHFDPAVIYGRQWWYTLDEEDEELRGTLAIVSHGCASYSVLVVSGPAAGRIVHVDLDYHRAPEVTSDSGFLAWYERWLDTLETGPIVTAFW